AAVAYLTVMHRLLREPILFDQRARGISIGNESYVSVPRKACGRSRISGPVRHVIAQSGRIIAKPNGDELTRSTSLGPGEDVRLRRRRIHLHDWFPGGALVSRIRVIDIVIA